MPEHGLNKPKFPASLKPDTPHEFDAQALADAERKKARRKSQAEEATIETAELFRQLNERLDRTQAEQERANSKNQKIQYFNLLLVILTLLATIVIGCITISQGREISTMPGTIEVTN